MTGMGLTRQQSRALAFIRRHCAMAGFAPSISEIIAALGLRSKRGGVEILRALEERGHIRRLPHRARAIELMRPASVSYFQIERHDGQARLVPLSEVRASDSSSVRADNPPVGNSPGASASGALSGSEA